MNVLEEEFANLSFNVHFLVFLEEVLNREIVHHLVLDVCFDRSVEIRRILFDSVQINLVFVQIWYNQQRLTALERLIPNDVSELVAFDGVQWRV